MGWSLYSKSFKVEDIATFVDWLVNTKLFQWISDNVQYIRLPCKRKCFPANYISFLQSQNVSTWNDLQYTVVNENSQKLDEIQVFNAMLARSKDKIDSRKASLTHIPTDQSSQHLSSLMKSTCKLYLIVHNAPDSVTWIYKSTWLCKKAI